MSETKPEISPRHFLALIGGALCIAFAPIFAVLSTRGDGGVGMWDAAFWRVFIGAIALAGLFGIRRERFWPVRASFSSGHYWIWLPGLVFAGDFWAWHWSFEHTSVANSTLLANTAILWVTLFAWLVWKEKLSSGFVIGAVVAFGGMVLLMLSSVSREPPTDGNPVLGDWLAILTAGFYAAYQLSMKHFRKTRSAPVLMFWASAVGAVVLLPLALWHEDPFWPRSFGSWGALLGIGVVSHACGQGLIAYGLGGVPASLASVTLLVQPVATAGLGVALLGQPLVLWQVIGAAIVLSGLALAVQSQATLSKLPVTKRHE
ncbi:MAG: EamA family transporter [Verrucomicrobiota bacterium]